MVWPFKKRTETLPIKKQTPQRKELLDLDILEPKGFSNSERKKSIEAVMQNVCQEDFPDNEDNIWSIRKYLDLKKIIFVMMESEPNDVGYDRFIFCMRIDSGQSPVSLAIYALHQENIYLPLSTAPDCPKDLPRKITWTN